MRWPVFAIFGFIFVIVQLSLRNVLMLHSLGGGGISPDAVACLAVFIALFAQRSAALWACWILGLVMDLAPQERAAGFHIIGEHALGYVFGGFVVLQLRTMVFRRRSLTVGFLTLVFVVAASIVAVFILSIRSWYTPGTFTHGGGALGEFARDLGIAVYSGLLAVPVGWLLGVTFSLWGFQSGIQRRSGGR